MALKPPPHPRLPPKPEPAEYNHRHGNKSCEPRRGRDPGNRPIDISQDRNTQEKVQRADDAALAGAIHKAFEEWFIVIETSSEYARQAAVPTHPHASNVQPVHPDASATVPVACRPLPVAPASARWRRFSTSSSPSPREISPAWFPAGRL